MAPIGTVASSISLTKQQFQGKNDPITGSVTLTFRPNTSSVSAGQELFGPLNLSVVLLGRLKLQVAENRTSHAYIWFYENRTLFSQSTTLFDGPFRLPANGSHPVHFQIQFPNAADYWQGTRDLLPPTFQTRFSAAAPRQAGKHQGAAAIEYNLRAEIEMPGIDVELLNDAPPTIIQYQPPSVFLPAVDTAEFSQTLQVQTYELLPEDERPAGLLDKTKAVLKNVSRPIYVFTATCDKIPKSIAIGQAIQFEVRIQAERNGTTTTLVPDIQLGECNLDLTARTKLYATNQKGVDSPKLDSSTVISSLTLAKQDPTGPFAKAGDYTKTISFVPVPSDLPSSFVIAKLSRSYRMRLELRFSVADQTVLMRQDMVVSVLPPNASTAAPAYSEANPAPLAGSSRILVDEALPTYEA